MPPSTAASRLSAEQLVLDANILIAYLDGDDPTHARAGDILASNAEASFFASAFNVAEALVYPARGGALDRAEDAFSLLDLNVVAIGEQDARPLAILRAETALKMPDLCALRVAQNLGASLATLDRRLAMTAREYAIEVIGA